MSGRPARKPWGPRDLRALKEHTQQRRKVDLLADALLGDETYVIHKQQRVFMSYAELTAYWAALEERIMRRIFPVKP